MEIVAQTVKLSVFPKLVRVAMGFDFTSGEESLRSQKSAVLIVLTALVWLLDSSQGSQFKGRLLAALHIEEEQMTHTP